MPQQTMWRNAKPNDSCRTPVSLCFFDTECFTDEVKVKGKLQKVLTFRLLCATAGRLENGKLTRRKEIQTTDLAEWWQWLSDQEETNRVLWVFAHNLAFDLTISKFWERLESGFYTLDNRTVDHERTRSTNRRHRKGKLVLESRPCYTYVFGRVGMVRFVDSLNYLPQSLEKIGASRSIPKLPLPLASASEETWFDYCRNDVKILETAVLDLMARWRADDCGVWQSTAPAMAMTSWRHIALKTGEGKGGHKVTYGGWPEATELERAGYYGGLVDAFYVGKIVGEKEPFHKRFTHSTGASHLLPVGPIYHLDVHGLYPSVMKIGWFPSKRVKWLDRPSVKQLSDLVGGYTATAEVFLDTGKHVYPKRVDGLLTMACGRLLTVLSGEELQRALGLGQVIKVVRACIYRKAKIFKEWVEHWAERLHEAERKGDESERTYCKLILVGLSGKFAQKPGRWVERPEIWPQKEWGYWIKVRGTGAPPQKCRAIGGLTQVWEDSDEPLESFPAISAHITALGRERMAFLRRLCPPRSVYYQGVDSLLCSKAAYDALVAAEEVDEKQLGKLRLKGIYSEGEISGLNAYRLDDNWIRSGFWGRSKRNEKGVWVSEVWDQIEGIISRRPDGSITVREIELTADRRTHKGTLSPDGWVSPVELWEDPPF